MTAKQSGATDRALADVKAGKRNAHAAAIHHGIHPSTIYRALKRQRDGVAKC